jgi:hypothetical protein
MGARALRVQIISPALAEIMGGRRLWTVSMISAVSMPSRDRRHAEVDVAELALDHLQRNTFAGHLDGVGVAQLVGGRSAAARRPSLRCGAAGGDRGDGDVVGLRDLLEQWWDGA